MAAWTRKEGSKAVAPRLGRVTAHPHYDRLAQRYSGVVAGKDPAAAMQWALTIKDPGMKAAAVECIAGGGKPKG